MLRIARVIAFSKPKGLPRDFLEEIELLFLKGKHKMMNDKGGIVLTVSLEKLIRMLH